jgi:general secretion pathway protein A
MYLTHFQMEQFPFSIAPDPRFLFMSERHREALAHLMYGVNSGGGVVLLTGEIGAGKTTVSRCLLEQVPPSCNIAYVFNPKLTVGELLASVCEEFRIALPPAPQALGGTRTSVDALNRFLLAEHGAGRNNVLVIDEAQNLSPEVLEQLRLLTNLETNERKLLQIILIGQPELRTMLAQPELEQLAQRVIAHTHLTALNEVETANYVQHRLGKGGLRGPSPFPPAMSRHVHRLSGGVPRRINLLCDRALLGAYAEGAKTVDRRILEHAAGELFLAAHARPRRVHRGAVLAGLVLALLGVGGGVLGNDWLRKAWEELYMTRSDGVHAPVLEPTQAVQEHDTSLPAIQNAGPGTARLDPARGQPGSALAAILPEPGSGDGPSFAALTDKRQALRELAALWGWSSDQDEPCMAARPEILQCYRSARGLAELRQLDRPAVLHLVDGSGKPYFAVLASLTDSGARLHAGSAFQDVDHALLTRHFRGEFTTLWRSAAGTADAVVLGQQGPAVDWIGAQLARVHNAELPPARQPYNLDLHRQVRLFQQAQGLSVDGVVGPLTFMHLNRVAGVSEPRLSSALRAH